MQAWQTILIAFGGNAALLAVLGLLGKSLLDKLIIRDTQEFQAHLTRQTQMELERLRDEMARDVESYKVQLKKSEVFFLRELEAASAFSSLFHSLLPAYSHPLIDWYEACDEIARNFGRIEGLLTDFMAKHAAMLTDEEHAELVDATSDAGYGKFAVVDGEVDPETNLKANDMYEKLKDLEAKLLARVRAQASL